MRAGLVVLGVVGILVASLPFASHADARPGTLAPAQIDPSQDGAHVLVWRGASALHLRGLCLPAVQRCVGSEETEDGRFFLPATGSVGRVTVSWRAVNDSLRELRVSVGAWELSGESPLVFDVPSATAGEYAVHAAPTRMVVGAHDQPLDWVATFQVGKPQPSLAMAGRAGYYTATGCVLILCDGTTLVQQGDRVFAPWHAHGSLTAKWDPKIGPLRVSLGGTGFVAEGSPPLALDLAGLAPGEWRVEVAPTTLALPTDELTITWSAALVPAP